jgi:hypothetical protein
MIIINSLKMALKSLTSVAQDLTSTSSLMLIKFIVYPSTYSLCTNEFELPNSNNIIDLNAHVSMYS